MRVEPDSLPAFAMRRSRRARKALRDLLARDRLASPLTGERSSPAGQEAEECEPSQARLKLQSRLSIILSLLCAVASVVLFGEGIWIKAKAQLAQILLDRAFTQSIATGRPVKPWQ